MKSYKLIHQLINLVEQLEEESQGQEVSIQDFTGFLLNKVGDAAGNNVNSEVRFGDNDSAALDIAYQLDNNIGRLFVFMSRYAKSYIKKALEGTPLQTAEDFTALAILLTLFMSTNTLYSNSLPSSVMAICLLLLSFTSSHCITSPAAINRLITSVPDVFSCKL